MKLIFDVDIENAQKSGIYIIKPNVGGKIYVGRTRNFLSRYYGHLLNIKNKKCNGRFIKFLEKYPYCTLTFSVLEITKNIKEREEYWIKELNAVHGGLNIIFNDEELTKNTIEDNQTLRKNWYQKSPRKYFFKKQGLDKNEN